MTSLRIADSVISREIGGSLVLLDVERCAYFRLESTAAAIWRSIETLARIDLVVDACASTFAAESANVDCEVRDFVESAVGWGLLRESPDENSAKRTMPFDDTPVLSVDRWGMRIAGDVEELRREFIERPYVELPGLVAPGLLSIIERAVERGHFAERAHPGIGSEVCLESGAATGACQLVFNDSALLDVITRVAGCAVLRCFEGRVYRLEPRSGHYDSWHSDASHNRLVGLSVNLSREAYEGGVLEIRRAAAAEAEHTVATAGFGSAILFRIAAGFRHRVTALHGERPRTAYAGWFRTSPDFGDAFLSALNSRAAGVAR